jgi:hypothetical protein
MGFFLPENPGITEDLSGMGGKEGSPLDKIYLRGILHSAKFPVPIAEIYEFTPRKFLIQVFKEYPGKKLSHDSDFPAGKTSPFHHVRTLDEAGGEEDILIGNRCKSGNPFAVPWGHAGYQRHLPFQTQDQKTIASVGIEITKVLDVVALPYITINQEVLKIFLFHFGKDFLFSFPKIFLTGLSSIPIDIASFHHSVISIWD